MKKLILVTAVVVIVAYIVYASAIASVVMYVGQPMLDGLLPVF